MEKVLSKRNYFFIGSMLFGLFFGAGNLIFPIYMGQEAGSKFLTASLGFIVTATGLPFLGVMALGLSGKSNLFELQSLVSKPWAYFFTVLLYLTIGPFFALPRTGTVSYEIGFAYFVPKEYSSAALFIFTLLFFLLALYFALYPSKILLWVGKILNPLFLIIISIIVLAVIFNPMSDIRTSAVQEAYMHNAFFTGFKEGYNTMDAMASLAFGIIVIDVIRDLGVKDDKAMICNITKSGFISVILMMLIYLSLAFMGAQGVNVFGRLDNGGLLFAHITRHYFGAFSNIVIAIIVSVACIKTAIGLISSCSDIFVEMFPNTLSYRVYAICFTIFSIAVANIGLSNIISFSIPVLMFAYPITIVSIMLGLFTKKFSDSRIVWQWTMAVAAICGFGDLLRVLPEGISSIAFLKPIVNILMPIYAKIPLADLGMSWLFPSMFTAVLCLAVEWIKEKRIFS